ncbi:hypothetical protein BU16DRAFT_554009 [Lophium mytilinum]|uniref:F-box domain-containing protein n=1 Tax=Lophium mytilinum TaxID=390894 RepID=A0A6A6RB59_9PEZI|nr:hypothetical protein BU16DRAFT_554009 [Lophium mytilinum]
MSVMRCNTSIVVVRKGLEVYAEVGLIEILQPRFIKGWIDASHIVNLVTRKARLTCYNVSDTPLHNITSYPSMPLSIPQATTMEFNMAPDWRTRPALPMRPAPPPDYYWPPKSEEEVAAADMALQSPNQVLPFTLPPRPRFEPFTNGTFSSQGQIILYRQHLTSIHAYVRRPWILECPGELIDLIAKFLPRNDFLSFRGLCKSIHEKSLHHLRNTHLIEKRVVLASSSRAGLNSLIDLLYHPQFASLVRKVTIHIEDSSFIWANNLSAVGKYGNGNLDRWMQHFNHPRLEPEQRFVDLVLLLRCLQKLPGLETINITDIRSGWVHDGIENAKKHSEFLISATTRQIEADGGIYACPLLLGTDGVRYSVANFCKKCNRLIEVPQCFHFHAIVDALLTLSRTQIDVCTNLGQYDIPRSFVNVLVKDLKKGTLRVPYQPCLPALREISFGAYQMGITETSKTHYPEFSSRVLKITIHIADGPYLWADAIEPSRAGCGDPGLTQAGGLWTQHCKYLWLSKGQRAVDLGILLACLHKLPALEETEFADIPYGWTAESYEETVHSMKHLEMAHPKDAPINPDPTVLWLNAQYCSKCKRPPFDPSGARGDDKCVHDKAFLESLVKIARNEADIYWSVGYYSLP